MVEGVGAKSKAEAVALMVEAKSLSTNGTKLLQSIKANMVLSFILLLQFFINQKRILILV